MHYYIMEGQKENGLFAKGFKGWWGACGAVGIGTGTWAVLFSIPEGACVCGVEGPMASIGPLALGAKDCVERLYRFAQGAADWRSGPRWSILSVLCPVHPLPLRGVPLKGKREIWREKQGVIYFMYHSGVSPFGGWRHHLSPASGGTMVA